MLKYFFGDERALDGKRAAYAIPLVLGFGVVDVTGSVLGLSRGSQNLSDTVFVAALFSQVGLVVVWAVFSCRSWSFRLCGTSLFAILLGGLMLLWQRQHAGGAAAILAMYSVAVGVIAGFGRLAGMRLVDVTRDDPSSPAGDERQQRQFSIRDLLIWTVLVALLLILYRRLGGPDFSLLAEEALSLMKFLAALGMMTLAVALVGLSSARAAVIWLAVIVVAAATAESALGNRGSDSVPVLLALIPAIELLAIWPFRFLGYRIFWRRRSFLKSRPASGQR